MDYPREEEVAMIPVLSLWLPILLSAVIVFVASSIIHMMLPYHRSDFGKVPSEDAVMDALRKFGIPPGDYMMPRSGSPKEMKAPEFVEKMKKGPVATLTVMASGQISMGASLMQWFIYCVVVSIFAAYIGSRALAPGADYLAVFRFVGTTAFVGYTLASWQNSIWYKRAWSTTLKLTIDGLVYGLLTAGTFGWLWPE
jgi:hypothetical protein